MRGSKECMQLQASDGTQQLSVDVSENSELTIDYAMGSSGVDS